MVVVRVTPPDEYERFAERLYNYAPTIQTRLDFDNAYNDYMQGMSRATKLKDEAWNILRTKYNIQTETTTKTKKVKSVKTPKIQKKFEANYLAKVWNPKTRRYRVAYVEMKKDTQGRNYYKDRNGKRVKVEKVKKL